MNKLLKRKQLLTSVGFVALGLVIGLAGLLLAVLPQQSKAHSLDTQIADAQTRLLSLHAHSQHGPAIKAADLFQLARAMPDDTDMPQILVDLAHAAQQSKVSIGGITPSDPIVQADGSSAIPLRLTVDGSWREISSFLRTLRTQVRADKSKLTVNGRLFLVDSVQLATRGDASQLEANLVVNAFTYGVAVPVVTDTTGTGTTSTTTTPAPGSAQAAGATGSAG